MLVILETIYTLKMLLLKCNNKASLKTKRGKKNHSQFNEFCFAGAPAPPAVGAGPGAVAAAVGLNMNQVEGLLVGALGGALGNVPAGFAPLLDIPPDADDETMVELAIALSLQVQLLGVFYFKFFL